MSADGGPPIYACRCLNIRLYRGRGSNQDGQQQPDPSAEYLPAFVGDEGIKISHNELTLRTRSRVTSDSTSTTGRTQQTLVTCLACGAAAYRVKAEIPPDEEAKGGPILPTEDWAERDTLRSKSGYVDVHVGKDGCIVESEIKRLLSSSSYSQYFSLVVPSEQHTLSTAAPAILPQARLTIPASHPFLPSLPPFLPLPPFTPSHPIFLHLSSIATARSNDTRRDTEKRIEEFVRRELTRLEEHESMLRIQLEHLWWIVKEGLKKAEQERDVTLLAALNNRRRSMSPGHAPVTTSGGAESFVVRNFVPSTYHAPRAIHSSIAHPSALSTSLATTSFHHPRAQQEANAAQANHTDLPENRTPSPPPYSSNPSSSRSSSGSVALPEAVLSRSFKRNMDESNDAAATYRFFVIEEQEAERRKVKGRARAAKDNEAIPKKDVCDSNKSVPSDNSKPASSRGAEAEKGAEKDSVAIDEKQTSPKRKDGRRKVTFNVEPNVVTIQRDITSETEERIPEKGEDLLFDMDGVSDPSSRQHEDQKATEDTSSEHDARADLVFHEVPERSQRSNRRQKDLKDAGLPQSFAALRPLSLPAPSNMRPPIRSRTNIDNNGNRSSVPQASNSGPSQVMDIKRQSSEGDLLEGVLPEQKDFLKLVAADTPSHRGLWKPGSDAWKIFDRNRRQTSSSDDEDDDTQASNTNGTDSGSTDLDWRHYRRTDLVGSLPIPMAPISQQKPTALSSLSYRPKTSLTERPGTLVPRLPTLTEENEDGKDKRSAASIRKEVYAERNKARGLDPGILDFTDDGEELESPEQDDDVNQISASRSRHHALEIIRSRDAVPPEGLWRSLAT